MKFTLRALFAVIALLACASTTRITTLQISSASVLPKEGAGFLRNENGEVAKLLKQICEAVNREPGDPPCADDSVVIAQLLQVAARSETDRAEVVRVMIGVVRDEEERRAGLMATRWLAAVEILGDIRTSEALDALIDNINETGQNGIIISIHFDPVGAAVRKYGLSAIPRLIEALGRPSLCRAAATNLADFKHTTVPQLIEVLYGDRHELKAGAAMALAWIGGDEAMIAIETAIENEKDEDIRADLNRLLAELRRRWRQ